MSPGNSHSRAASSTPCDFRHSVCRFPPLAAADSGPLDPITLRACIQVLGDKQYEHVVQILREDWGITEGETLEGYLLNIKELRKKE